MFAPATTDETLSVSEQYCASVMCLKASGTDQHRYDCFSSKHQNPSDYVRERGGHVPLRREKHPLGLAKKTNIVAENQGTLKGVLHA